MDVRSLTRSPKKQKISEENDVDGEDENGIGRLTDPLLVYILSFLPTKDAVRTSILSKRWECLWMSVPDLYFKEDPLPSRNFEDEVLERAREKRVGFMDFVERVLLLHDLPTIESFSLTVTVIHEWGRISAWVSAAVRRKVQVLELTLKRVGDSFVLPSCIFTCESLEGLTLNVPTYFEFPHSTRFSNLKILTLAHVTFPDDDTLKQIFVVCPVLEELSLICCNFEHVKAVCINGPKLRRLTIVEDDSLCPDDAKDDDNDNPDEGNEKNFNVCQFTIFGARLVHFLYIGDFFHHYCFYDSSSMADAYVFVERGHRKTAYRAFRLLIGLSESKSLFLTDKIFEGLSLYARELLDNLPEFYNLNHIGSYWTLLFTYRQTFLAMLQRFPRLKSLKLNGASFRFGYDGRNDWALDPVPACFCTHLKIIGIARFWASEHELYTVGVLLLNATVLEKLVISFNPQEFDGEEDLRKRQEVCERIMSFPKASRNCVVVTYFPSTDQ
ncbi:F-box/FBD/LRR-repeat protein At3g52680-like [Malania oleifera]|uniref:F-box/FBD/LRR-repeat protein At3g52680-like n=1 Tax=Malania oleifera TaxID=397392 RepID=UPI0025AE520C|nr:F-box/FBD/LRR-repeat protein At3g52680-like [Malania oleifera]